MELGMYMIARQPILDNHQNITAYELLFRSSDLNTAVIEDNVYATSLVIYNTLNQFGIPKLLGRKLGFINADDEVLRKGFLRNLPKTQFIIEILEFTRLDKELIDQIYSMKEEGYVFALDDFTFDDEHIQYFEPLFKAVSIIKVDIKLNTREMVKKKLGIFEKYQVSFLAEKVENMDEFKFYKDLGFKYFQGYYFEKPSIIRGKGIDPSKMQVLSLINMIYKDSDMDKLEAKFKEYPDLTINLLKFINSAAIANRSKITSVRQALALLGQKQLMNWLLLLSYASIEGTGSPLLMTALERAKTMELLLKRILKKENKPLLEEAYLTGLLSLIDALFQVPMDDVIKGLNLSEAICDAILYQKNILGKVLEIINRTEKNDIKGVISILEEMNISLAEYNEISMESFCWAQSNGKQMCIEEK
jgi:c-di-GMP phosphodiesterase